MRDLVDTLPLRLAATVAAIVGVICLLNGVELWTSALRIGIAFAVLLVAGLVVRRFLLTIWNDPNDVDRMNAAHNKQAGADDPSSSLATGADGVASSTGQNVDFIAPGTPIGDLLREEKNDEERR